jgi:myosin heavy subunit
MELNFDKNNKVIGSTIISYLLEKSRLTNRTASVERNYHIFYQLLRGFPEEQLSEWRLGRQTYDYSILMRQPGVEAPNLNDEKCFQETMDGFEDMGFSPQEIRSVLQLVAAVLHLGNIDIVPLKQGEASAVAVNEDGSTSIAFVAELLGVEADELAYSICNKTSSAGARKSITVKNLKPNEARDTRDSLIRNLYERQFLDIVRMINYNNRTDASASARSLGLLDIFGFEIFEENSIEQLCINYCNEMLQNHFNFVIFTAEKELYAREGIVCDTIVFKDNLPIITDIEVSHYLNL